jgi:hypothetical protein
MVTLNSEQVEKKAKWKWDKTKEGKLRNSIIGGVAILLIVTWVAGALAVTIPMSAHSYPITGANITYNQNGEIKTAIWQANEYNYRVSDTGFSCPVIWSFVGIIGFEILLLVGVLCGNSVVRRKYIQQILQQWADNNKQLPALFEYEEEK